MLIKKLMIPLIGMALGTSVMAAEYKIGDKMPSHENEASIHMNPWEENGVAGLIYFYDINDDRKADFLRITRFCGKKEIVFGYFNDKKLYLDNNPNDGKIDAIYDSVKGRSASEDAPKCGLKV